MRKSIVAANWKMNKNIQEGMDLMIDLITAFKETPPNSRVIIAPPFIHLTMVREMLLDVKKIKLAAQNCHFESQGAFTGEVSPTMLQSLKVDYVILGHSERRELFGETDEMISKKVKAALSSGLKVIFCCGEPLNIRESNQQEDYVQQQIAASILNLNSEELKNVVIAYEPIWAIGTGRTASPEQAQEMHAYIRGLVKSSFGEEQADDLSILYGGSVKPGNAGELFGQTDVDGGLVGGASLVAEDFAKIAQSI